MPRRTMNNTRSDRKGCSHRIISSGAVALVCYLLYNSFFLLPLHFDITHKLIGQTADPLQWIWFFRWFPYALTHGLNPLFSRVIWAPGGINLTWTTGAPVLALVCWPITALWGPFVSYNIVVLTAPALSAWITFLLCRELTGRFFPALFGGWLFGFSSYELGQLCGHPNLFVTWPVPLLVWLALRWYRGKLGDWGLVATAAAALLFLFGTSVEIFMTTILSSVVVISIAFGVFHDAPSRRRLLRLGYLAAWAVLAAGLLVSPYLWFMLFGPDRPQGSIYAARMFSTALANVLIPARTTWLDGGALQLWLGPFPGGMLEQGAYIGIPLLVIWVLFIIHDRHTDRGQILFYSAGILLLLSLGPWLTIFKHPLPIPLPWWGLNQIPLLQDALPIRLTLYVSLATAVMAAVWLADTNTNWKLKLVLVVASTVFLLPNFTLMRLWRIDPKIPVFFTQGMYKHFLQRNENVLVLPMDAGGKSILWQAESNFYFRIAGGYLGPPPPQLESNPVVRTCLYGMPPANAAAALRQFIRRSHIGAIITSTAQSSGLQCLSIPCVHRIDIGGVDLYQLRLWSQPQIPFTHRRAADHR